MWLRLMKIKQGSFLLDEAFFLYFESIKPRHLKCICDLSAGTGCKHCIYAWICNSCWHSALASRIFLVIHKWAATRQNQQNDCASSEDSDQPGHLPGLIRVFAVRMKKVWLLSYPLSAQQSLWSDWVAVTVICWNCHEAAQMAFTTFIKACLAYL